jgi:signal transduction histidine kinase
VDALDILLIVFSIGCGVALGIFAHWSWERRRQQPVVQQSPKQNAPTDLVNHLFGQTKPKSLLEQATHWIHTKLGYPVVVAYLFDDAIHQLHQPVVAGAELPDLPASVRLGSLIYGQLAADALRNRLSPRYLENIERDTYFGPVLTGMHAAYVTQLWQGSTFYGVVAVQSPHTIDEEQRAALEGFAQVISSSLATSRRLDQMEQVIERFDQFQKLTQRLSAHLITADLLKEITQTAREMFDTEMSILMKVAPNGTLLPVAWAGISDEGALAMKTHFKGDLKGLVAWAKQPARTADLRTDQRTVLAREALFSGMLSELAVPVLYGDKLYGVLAVESTQHRYFTDEEMALLSSLGAQAGIALNNAEIFNQTERALAFAERASKFKTEFINNMSHELRTPLNAVINFTRLVSDGFAGPISEQQKQYLGYVHDSGQQLLGLINDILDLAKIETGKLELTREETDIEPILRGVMSTTVGLTKDKGIKLVSDWPANLPKMLIDGRRVRQVLLNILSNAAKFTTQGSITLKAELTNDKLIMSVQDTGIGMRPEDISKVFEEFQQIDNPMQSKVAGTGLGMPISRRFILLHGGDMWIDSHLGRGTIVYFSLPLVPPSDEMIRIKMKNIAPAAIIEAL